MKNKTKQTVKPKRKNSNRNLQEPISKRRTINYRPDHVVYTNLEELSQKDRLSLNWVVDYCVREHLKNRGRI